MSHALLGIRPAFRAEQSKLTITIAGVSIPPLMQWVLPPAGHVY
jgi:hypothetical protein